MRCQALRATPVSKKLTLTMDSRSCILLVFAVGLFSVCSAQFCTPANCEVKSSQFPSVCTASEQCKVKKGDRAIAHITANAKVKSSSIQYTGQISAGDTRYDLFVDSVRDVAVERNADKTFDINYKIPQRIAPGPYNLTLRVAGTKHFQCCKTLVNVQVTNP